MRFLTTKFLGDDGEREIRRGGFSFRTIMIIDKRFLGDDGERETPVPIPNTAVKTLSADGTAASQRWESRTSPGLIRNPC